MTGKINMMCSHQIDMSGKTSCWQFTCLSLPGFHGCPFYYLLMYYTNSVLIDEWRDPTEEINQLAKQCHCSSLPTRIRSPTAALLSTGRVADAVAESQPEHTHTVVASTRQLYDLLRVYVMLWKDKLSAKHVPMACIMYANSTHGHVFVNLHSLTSCC